MRAEWGACFVREEVAKETGAYLSSCDDVSDCSCVGLSFPSRN